MDTTGPQILQAVIAAKNSLVNGPDLSATNALKHIPDFYLYGDTPNTNSAGTVLPYGEISGYQYWDYLHIAALPFAEWLYSTTTDAQYADYWFINDSGYYSSIGNSNGSGISPFYVFLDPAMPSLNIATAPTAYAFNQTDAASCTSIWGSSDNANCLTNGAGFYYAVSKTGFTAADTKLRIDTLSNSANMDHSYIDSGNRYGIHRNVDLLAGDNSTVSTPWTGSIELGGTNNLNQSGSWAVVTLPRWTDGTNEGARISSPMHWLIRLARIPQRRTPPASSVTLST